MVKRVVPKALVACLIGMVSLAAQGCVAQSPSRTPVSPSSPRATPSSVTASPRTTTASPTPVPTRPRDVAVAAALRTNGKTYAYETGDASGYKFWVPGPESEWSGDCLFFVRYMYQRAGVDIGQFPTAGDAYKAYAKVAVKGGEPPRGAVVFWPHAAGGIGHVAISLGDGTVVTTQGMDGSRLPNAIRPISSFDTAYWMMPKGA